MPGTEVVDPLRVPDWLREPIERAWREMPPLARIFVSLAVVDVLGRAIGLLAPPIDWTSLTPLSFVGAFVPHDLWILLPAILVIRRPDAATASPWILRGAVVVAATELLARPLQSVLWGPGLGTIAALVAGLASVGLLAGWSLLARGLTTLTPGRPSETIRGLANLAAASVGLLAAVAVAQVVTAEPIDVGDPAYTQALTLSNLATAIRLVAWAWLLWILVRGMADPRRIVPATLAGAGAMTAAFLPLLIFLAWKALAVAGFDFARPSGLQEVLTILGWLGEVVGPTLILVAFALGLAEPPVPDLPPDEEPAILQA